MATQVYENKNAPSEWGFNPLYLQKETLYKCLRLPLYMPPWLWVVYVRAWENKSTMTCWSRKKQLKWLFFNDENENILKLATSKDLVMILMEFSNEIKTSPENMFQLEFLKRPPLTLNRWSTTYLLRWWHSKNLIFHGVWSVTMGPKHFFKSH